MAELMDALTTSYSDPKYDFINFLIKKAADTQQLPPNLLKAVAIEESGMNPQAKSSRGAVGLMQLRPLIAKSLGVDPYDLQENIQGGAQYLGQLRNQYSSLGPALSAYNYGPTAVTRRQQAGRSMPRQVSNYVNRVLQRQQMLDTEDISKKLPPEVTRAMTMALYPKLRIEPEYRGKAIENPDETMSSERTMTVGFGKKFYNIPTLVNGKKVTKKQAVDFFKAGIIPAVGVYDSKKEATDAAEARSNMLQKESSAESSDSLYSLLGMSL